MKRVVTFGVFDFFHIGHLNLFERCRAFGDYLIVAVQDGNFILKYKPEAEVLYSTEDRLRLVSTLRTVDEAFVYTAVDEDIKNVDFDVFVVGEDQIGPHFQRAIKWAKENGYEVVRLTRTKGISSSSIKKLLKKDDEA